MSYTFTQMKERLWELGHFNNPENPTHLRYEELGVLEPSSTSFQTALRSFQEFMAPDYMAMGVRYLNKTPKLDGVLGEASRALFEVQRCGCPDYPIEGQAGGGSGSWPEGCHPEYPDDHVMSIYLNKSNMPSFLGSRDDPNSACERALDLCIRSYARVGLRIIRLQSASSASSVMSFTRGRGWIGLAIVPSSFSCRMGQIWAKFDTSYSPSALIDQWARLFAHELGHNCGWGHWRGGIMNPSIIGGVYDVDEWVNDPSWERVKRSFGGKPIDNGGPTPPNPPGDGEALIFRGQVDAYGAQTGNFYGTYQLGNVPPPNVGAVVDGESLFDPEARLNRKRIKPYNQ